MLPTSTSSSAKVSGSRQLSRKNHSNFGQEKSLSSVTIWSYWPSVQSTWWNSTSTNVRARFLKNTVNSSEVAQTPCNSRYWMRRRLTYSVVSSCKDIRRESSCKSISPTSSTFSSSNFRATEMMLLIVRAISRRPSESSNSTYKHAIWRDRSSSNTCSVFSPLNGVRKARSRAFGVSGYG